MSAYFSDKQAARITGLTPEAMRTFRFHGIKNQGPGKLWSDRQVLGLAVKSHSRRVGATKAASTQALQILSHADIGALRRAIADGKRYLRLLGEVCDTNLVSERAAYHPKTMQAATDARVPYVIVDLAYWMDRLDAEPSTPPETRKAVAV